MDEATGLDGAARTRAWAPPEAGPSVPAPPRPGAPATGEAPVDKPSPQIAVPVPVPLRPFTVGDVLDGGIAVIKTAPRTVLTIAAVFVVPVQLVASYVNRDALGDRSLAETFETALDNETVTVGGAGGAALGAFLAASVLLPFVAAAVARLVSGWYVGESPSTGDALRTAARAAPALLAAWVLVHALELGAALLLLFPGLMVMTAFLITAPAIAVERIGPVAGMRRSWRLVTAGRFWPTMGVAVLIAAVESVLSLALTSLAVVFSGLPWSWVAEAVFSSGAALVTTPFVAAATTLVYLDLRIRVEGLDILLGAAEHLPDDR